MSQTNYEIQNFDALNNAIDDEHQKALNKIGLQRSKNFKRYMLYGSLFLASLALLIFAIGIAYWLFKEKPNNLITQNEYITNNYEFEKNISQLEKIIERSKEFDGNNNEQITNGEEVINQQITEEYYLFKNLTYTTDDNRKIEVTTGQVFDPDNIDFPYEQYCYTMILKDTDEIRIFLADKKGTENKTNFSYKNSYNQSLSYNDFINAQKYCSFRNF